MGLATGNILSPTLAINGVAVTIAVENMGDRAVVERYSPEPSADVTFLVPYESRNLVVLGLLGGILQSGKSISRLPPLAYPPNPNLCCLSIGDTVGIKPRTNQLGWVEYSHVLMPAHFGVPTWDFSHDTPTPDLSNHLYTTTKFKGNVEVFSPPTATYFYKTGTYSGKPVAEANVGFVRSRCEIQFTRHRMPFVPVKAITAVVGGTNLTTITLADFDFPQGQLLLATWDVEPSSDPASGARTWDVTFNLLGDQTRPWNQFMDPAGSWVEINSKADGSGSPPFTTQALNTVMFGDDFS